MVSTSDQRARRSAASTGSSQRDTCVRLLFICWYVKRYFVLCVCAFQSGHVGVGCISGEIMCRYSINSGHLFDLSCSKVRLVYLGSICSCAYIFGGASFITLLFVVVCRRLCTIVVCMRLILFFTVCKVIVSGVVSLFVVWFAL